MLHVAEDDGGVEDERLARAYRRAAREREARRAAEMLLEQKSLELYQSNEQLRQQASRLEAMVDARTAELSAALEQATAATRAKSDFLATMSHEIRTPLNAVIGLADVLAMSPLNDEQERHLAVLIRSAGSLLNLVNDILDFSKIESGHLELERRDFDPAAEIGNVVEAFRPQVEAKDVTLEYRVSGLPAVMRGDSLRVRQIATNLLSNAAKFTAQGRIVVALSATAREGGWELRLTVSDTGVGVKAEVMERLFEPFMQGDSSITRNFGGTGLGLAISRRLAELMAGTITVTSGEAGSTFAVTLSLEAAAAEPVRIDAQRAATLPRMSVLVVDDHDTNRMVAQALLRKLGQRVVAAASGPEAIEFAGREAFDLILMDMQMPGMDGLTATREIRSLPLTRQPRIVALTANAFDRDRERCLEAGMDAFVTKPVRAEDVSRELLALSGAA